MAFGSAGYTPTFSGDLTAAAGKKLWKELSKRYKKRRIAKKLEERRKAKTPQQKKEVEERAKEEEKQDQQEIQEVKVEEVKEEKKQVAATQKLLSSAKNPTAVNNDVIPVTVKDVTGKPTTQLLPAAKKSGARRGGGFTPLPGVTPNILPPAQDTVKQTTAIVKRNNDALVTAIKGEVNDVRSAIVDVSFETVETRNMMGVLINEEKRQTAAFKKQADILEDSTKFKKRRYQQQLIFFKQQRSREKKDRTGAAAVVSGSSGGGGGLPNLGLPSLASLLPLLRGFRPRGGRNRPRGRRGAPRGGRRGRSGAGGLRTRNRGQRFRNRPGLRDRYNRFRQFRRNRRLAPLLRLLRGGGRGLRGLSNLALIGGAYGLDAVIDMAERRSMTPGRGVTNRSQLGPQMQQRIDDAAAARNSRPQPTRSLTQAPGGSSSLSTVRDPVAETRRRLAEEVRSKGLSSKSTYVTNARGQRELVEVTKDQVDEILKKPKVPLFKRLMALADSRLSKVPILGPIFTKVKKGIVALKEGVKKLTLPKAVDFLQKGFQKIRALIPDKKFGISLAPVKKGFDALTAPVRGGLKLLKTIGSGAKGLAKTFGPVLRGAGRVLGPLLELGFFAMDSKTRMDNGKSPAAAMLPLIPRIALTAGGAALLGAVGGPLAPLTAIAGGFLGGLLGDKVVDFIDSQWSPEWDSGFFKNFNNDVYGLLGDKLGYAPPRSAEEAQNRRIEAEAAELGVDPSEFEGYTGGTSASTGTREAPAADTTQGGTATRLTQAVRGMFANPTPKTNLEDNKLGYPADTGLDIEGQIGDPIVSPVDGTLEYAEQGHTSWTEDSDPNKPGYQPQHSFRIKLDKPFQYGGKTVNFVYGTHLSELDPAVANKSGIRISKGQMLGKMGQANGVPHLHLGLVGNREQTEFLNFKEVKGALTSGALDGGNFQPPPSSQQSSTRVSSAPGGGNQTIAVQLPPNLYPSVDGNQTTPTGPRLERVNNELLFMQNVEAKVLVG